MGEDAGLEPSGGLAEGAVEVVGERREFSKTYENPDGTRSTVMSLSPLHYRDGVEWDDIDTSVVPDPAVDGGLMSAANEWTAHFAPLPDGVTIETTDGPVAFAPVGAAAVEPEALPAGDGVIYRDAWPGVDLRYQVLPGGVKEDLLLKVAPTVDRFEFRTGGRLWGLIDGLLRPLAGGDELGALLDPEVFDATGRLLSDASPRVTSLLPLLKPATLRVSFDRDYLASLPESAYPIAVDPTWVSGSSNLTAYKSDGYSCGGCGLKVGNTLEPAGNRYWRSVGYFDYAPVLGQPVTNAVLNVSDRTFGSTQATSFGAYWASAYSYAGAPGNGLFASATFANAWNLGGSNFTALYNYWTTNNVVGGSLGFVGDQTPGVYTYKSFASATLTLTYGGSAPSAPRNVVATDNHDGSVTVTWDPPSSNGGAAITGYTVRAWQGGQNPNTTAPFSTQACGSTCSSRSWTSIPEGAQRFYAVTATNSVGESSRAYSATITIHRYPGAPPSMTAHQGNQQAQVIWTAAPTNGGPAIDSYAVAAFHPTNPNLNIVETACGGCRSHVLTGLQNDVDYTVVVRAHNPNGYSDTWASGTVMPTANPVPYPPRAQTATGGNSAVMITWQAPLPNGGPPVTDYVIQLYEGTTFITQTGLLPATGLHNRYLWSGLTNGVTYTFRIVPYGYWFGGTADATATPSANPSPYQPRNPQVTPAAGSALATWQAPETGPAPDRYLIQVFEETGGFVSQQETLTGADTAAVITGLDQSTSYLLLIYSHGPAGYSTPVATEAFTPSTGSLLSPINVTATRGDTQATVTWQPPTVAIDGLTTYTVTAYRAADDATVATAETTEHNVTVTGLMNGTPVYFRVVATNLLIAGPPSESSNTVTPAGPPFAPENLAVERGDTEIGVTWAPPSERSDGTPGNNGDPITSYEILTYRAADDSLVSTTETSDVTATVTGLQNGTAYYVRVQAINGVGTGDPTDPSDTVIPAGPPFAPENVQATATDQQAHITWDPPSTRPDGTPGDNGDAISSYTVTASPGGQSSTVPGTQTSADVFDLTNGTTFTFTVTATNSTGTGPASLPSNPVTPAGPPSTPTNVTAVAGDESATVSWDPSDPNGAPVTYTVTASPGGASATTAGTTVEVDGLQNGTSYTFTVVAANDAGSSVPSSASNAVTPMGSPTAPTLTQVANADEAIMVAWLPPADTNGATITGYRLTIVDETGGGGFSIDLPASELDAVVGDLENGNRYTVTVRATSSAGLSPVSETGIGYPLESTDPAPRVDAFAAIGPPGTPDNLPCWRPENQDETFVCREFETGTFTLTGISPERVKYDNPADEPPPGACDGATLCVGGGGAFSILAADAFYEGCSHRWPADEWTCSSVVIGDHTWTLTRLDYSGFSYYLGAAYNWAYGQAQIVACVYSLRYGEAQDIADNCGHIEGP